MQVNYEDYSKILKAISDPKRLQIIDILSCGERCACDILEYFDFTQPTLSHHMKILADSNIVNIRKEGLWSYYSLNLSQCNNVLSIFKNIFTESDDCICRSIDNKACK